jgi:HPt (histidine-containing phosphotransfer) domain-containing protein
MDSGRELIVEIEKATQQGHWERVNRAVHTLKGSASHFGATQLIALCHTLETALNAGDGKAVEQGASSVVEEFQSVRRTLAGLVNREDTNA